MFAIYSVTLTLDISEKITLLKFHFHHLGKLYLLIRTTDVGEPVNCSVMH